MENNNSTSLVIPHGEIQKLLLELIKNNGAGQWLVAPELHPSEQLFTSKQWQFQPGKKPVIQHPRIKVSVGLPTHLPKEVPHYHGYGIELYNFQGSTRILEIQLKAGAKVNVIELPEGGYYFAYPGDSCHLITENQDGWDNFYFADQPFKKNEPVDKIICAQCPYQGQCALEARNF